MPSQQQPVALVTGASSGMGRDFALRLLKEGYAVYGAARAGDYARQDFSALLDYACELAAVTSPRLNSK